MGVDWLNFLGSWSFGAVACCKEHLLANLKFTKPSRCHFRRMEEQLLTTASLDEAKSFVRNKFQYRTRFRQTDWCVFARRLAGRRLDTAGGYGLCNG